MRKKLGFLIAAILLGFVVFAVAYPFTAGGGVVTGY